MKKLLMATLALLMLVGSTASARVIHQEIYRGVGRCYIETFPCANGVPISCQASGIAGGNCIAFENDNTWTVQCTAFGGGYGPTSRYSRSCKIK